ncbi:MAG: type VI secretion system ATPase TssH, partial [Betaproteobacteria bacterium]|nr:type VI secretion system ATPase TssH [Betaproteobacteria bacterium]
MRIDKLTTQLQQALAEAQSLCIAQDHPYIEAAHVVLALLQQPEGSGRALLERAGARLPALKTGLEGLLARIAKVQGGDGQVQVSRELSQLLNLAEKEAGKRGDHYVASEMLLLALMDKEGVGECGKALREAGLSRTSLETAIQALRGGHSVQSPEAEGQREALKKYTVDLTERASLGKLDPVIGRDDEIRRAIQILQRRTKNNPVLIGEPGVCLLYTSDAADE